MVDTCGPNVVDGPLSWLNTRPVILEQKFLTTFASRSPEQPKKARPKLATQAFSRFAKAGKQSVFHRNLGGDVGRHRFPSPRTLMKTALAPNRAKAVKDILWSGRREVQGFASQTLVSLRAIGPCVLRWKMLTHFLSFAPCRVRFPSPGTLMKTALAPNRAKAVKDILWSGRRESNPRHQLGRLGFYH